MSSFTSRSLSTAILLLLLANLFLCSQAGAQSSEPGPKSGSDTNWLPPLGDPLWTFSPGAVGQFTRKDDRTVVEIRVSAPTKPSYQQALTVLQKGNLPGARFQLTVDVRTRDVTGDVGAYAVIEFLDRDQKRIGIVSSPVSPLNGANEWTPLAVAGSAPKETTGLRIGLILHANGVAWFSNPKLTRLITSADWPDLGAAVRVLTPTRQPVTGDLIGVGFHCFQHDFNVSQDDFDLIYRRWDDLNPSFARVNHSLKYGQPELDRMAKHLLRMQKTGTVFYITTWDPPVISSELEYLAYAKRVADDLSYLVKEKGCTGIRWYCMSNELSLTKWGSMRNDLPRFRQYHQALFNEFKKRGLKIGLLATDSSDASSWPSIAWAAKNMPDITAAYGGHHYINDYDVRSLDFAPWWEQQCRAYIGLAKEQHKPFIIGEFGSKQDGTTKNGVNQDRCVYYETPEEPWVGLQISEAVIGALRAGADAIGYWTLMDLPDNPFSKTYLNKWGLFRNSGRDFSFRSPYYAYGLLTRNFRAGLKIFPLDTEDKRIRAVAGQSPSGAWTVAIINRNERAVHIKLKLPRGIHWQANRYQPEHVETGVDGLLPAPGKLESNEFEIASNEMVVLVQR